MSFDVDSDDFEAPDIEKIAKEETFRAAVNTQNRWREILDQAGWRNTGEAINDVTVEPKTDGASEYLVGGDVVQLAIAEFGRRPGAKMPPYEPIADWVHEQEGMLNRGESKMVDFGDGPVSVTFDSLVFLVRRAISDKGIEPIGAGRKAFREESENAAQRIDDRVSDEME